MKFPRLFTTLPILLALTAAWSTLPAQEKGYSAYHDYRVVPVVDGLVRPWSLAFLPGGDMLVTEKPGRLRIVRDGRLLDEPVAGLPPIHAEGQGGLLDVVPHPDYADNGWLYLSYSKPLADGESTTAVIRGRLDGGRLVDIEELFEAQSRGRGHYGSRLAFDGEGHLFITVGDRQATPAGDLEAHPAQDLSNHHGVVIRLNEDGSVPSDNPFVDRDGALPEIWSYGHRNAQGLIVDRESGNVWITEHGPQGGDELNLIAPGVNYGWPVIGLAMYQGDAFPNWRGHLLAGGLSGQRVDLLELDGTEVVREEILVRGIGRVRDVRIGPDGFVYLALDDRDGAETAIVRLEPVPRAEVSR